MTKDEFFEEYIKGRRDFEQEKLQNFDDTFNYNLGITHPEFFVNDLSSLVLRRDPVVYKPLDGVRLENLSKASIEGSSFLRANFKNANLRNLYAQYADLSSSNMQGADLTGADLRNTHLVGVDFANANLEESDLRNAKLVYCNLSSAVLKRAKLDNAIIKWCNLDSANLCEVSCADIELLNSTLQNAIIINSNFERAYFHLLKFGGSKVSNSNFKKSRLARVSFSNAVVLECDFSACEILLFDTDIGVSINFAFFAENAKINKCNFKRSVLSYISLAEVDFGFSDFSDADLSYSSFKDVVLDGAIMARTNFSNAYLNRVSLNGVKISDAFLIDMNLNEFLAEELSGPYSNYIDHRSIAKTIAEYSIHPLDTDPVPKLKEFLVNAGMPYVVAIYLIDSIRTLNPNQLVSLMRSTFISYGAPDEEFATILNKDLLANGVATFFFPLNAKFGEKLHTTMRRVDEYDRIILICSERSLDRAGLQFELEKVLEREARGGGESYLIPIVLDDYLFSSWQPKRSELKQEILNRVVGDFRKKENYKNQLERLIEALRKSDYELLKYPSV